MDRRIIRTRKLLLDALIDLMLEKSYDSITVKDITDQANVGRSTFYAHFESKEQLLFSGDDTFTDNLYQHVTTSTALNSLDFFKVILEHIQQHQTLAKALLKHGDVSLMLNRMKLILIQYFENRAQKEIVDTSKIPLFSNTFAGAMMGQVTFLFSNFLEHL